MQRWTVWDLTVMGTHTMGQETAYLTSWGARA